MVVSSGCGLGVWGVSFSLGGRQSERRFFGTRNWGEMKGSFLPAGFEGRRRKW